MMKIDLLPNEIFIEIFEYLNGLDIFYAFDQLNFRFYQLIRNIPLYVNCENINKTIFDKFCTKISFNSEIIDQIYSIRLSNKDTCHQIEKFLSIISLNKFPHLHSLTLIEVDENNVKNLQSMLPFISELYSFHLIASKIDETQILNILPMSNLRILSTPILKPINKNSITHLTLSGCSLIKLYQLFDHLLILKYLKIQIVCKTYSRRTINTYMNKHKAIHLKQLIIGEFRYHLEDFSMLVKHTPNLKNLTISTSYYIDMIHANQWEYLITSTLPYLKIFKFIFSFSRVSENDNIIEKYNQFQSDFWHKQHHWYTEYSYDYCSGYIYTIPYLSNTFNLKLYTTRLYSNNLTNNLDTFDNVTDLILYYRAISNNCPYYFSNITSLKLITALQDYTPTLKAEYIQITKTVVNFFNLKHLDISMYDKIATSSILLDILKNAPQLSSIIIKGHSLILLLNDENLCKYLRKRIIKLDMCKYGHSFNNSNEIKRFCKVFSNIEQLDCSIYNQDDILRLLEQLPKLSTLNVYSSGLPNRADFSCWIEEKSRERNFLFHMKDDDKREVLNIWMGTNTF